MNNQYQELIFTLSGEHNMLLTSLLCTKDPGAWDDCKHVIVCPIPLLTLEMAINRVTSKEHKTSSIPSPEQIKDALNYAKEKRTQYLRYISDEVTTHN